MNKADRRWLGTTDPFARLRKIETMDLEQEYREICVLFYSDFQSAMMTKGFTGFMFNNAAPRISAILAETGELEHRLAKRVVDTTVLASAVMTSGFKEGAGRDAARRVNAMHSRYDIHPDDFIAVAVEEILGSIELAERHGWREVTAKEREALRLYYSHQARAFGGSKAVPDSLDGIHEFWNHYLDHDVYYAPQNERLARVLLNWYKGMAPKLERPFVEHILISELDPRIARACGLAPAKGLSRRISQAFLGYAARKDPLPDGAPSKLQGLVDQVYPQGYGFEDLGTHSPKG